MKPAAVRACVPVVCARLFLLRSPLSPRGSLPSWPPPPPPQGEPLMPLACLTDLVPGQQLLCYILEVADDALWLGAGPGVRDRKSVV